MKYFSFIAVLFYLSLLFPAAGHSASSSWVDVQKANQNFSAALVISASQPGNDSTECSGDDDKTIVNWNEFEFPSSQSRIYQRSEFQFSQVQQRCYPARAPPLYLS